MVDTADENARVTVEAVPDPEPKPEDAPATDASGAHRPATCPVAWCPICLAVTAVQPVKPEVVEHLLKAGAEFFLAMRSLIDARADEVAGEPDDGTDRDLHKIDIG